MKPNAKTLLRRLANRVPGYCSTSLSYQHGRDVNNRGLKDCAWAAGLDALLPTTGAATGGYTAIEVGSKWRWSSATTQPRQSADWHWQGIASSAGQA